MLIIYRPATTIREETVSSRPDEGNDVQGSNLATARAEDDGDTLMSEAREGDLD